MTALTWGHGTRADCIGSLGIRSRLARRAMLAYPHDVALDSAGRHKSVRLEPQPVASVTGSWMTCCLCIPPVQPAAVQLAVPAAPQVPAAVPAVAAPMRPSEPPLAAVDAVVEPAAPVPWTSTHACPSVGGGCGSSASVRQRRRCEHAWHALCCAIVTCSKS